MSWNSGRKDAVTAVPKKQVALRPDIQGLRALAVIAVIADHLFAWPGGGFVGVDVFFVLSGFLITGLLLREHERTGGISFADFYRRRIRRIIPLAVLVLVATGIASWLIYSTARAMSITLDEIWSFFFLANWHFAAIGTDYMQNSGPLSPVQHFWSLAVEEQFYIVWPWIMVLILGVIAARRGWTRTIAVRWVFAVMFILTAASFGWAMWDSVHSPTVAYFSTFSRAWELGLGALVAAATPVLTRLPKSIRPVLGWAGLAAIIVSMFVVSSTSTFPAPWAALPVVGSALVIVGGIGVAPRFLWPLTNPVSKYLGDISYSLYLWHFPIIVLLAAFFTAGDPSYYVVVLLTTIVVSVLSFHLVEDPIRKSPWLEPNQRRGRWRRRFRRVRESQRFRIGGLVVVVAITAVVVVPAFIDSPRPDTYVANAAAVPVPTVSGTPVPVTIEQTLQARIVTSLAASSFPDTFTPSVDSLGTQNWINAINAQGCGDITPDTYQKCTTGTGSANKTVVVLGDSFGIAWMPAIKAAFEPAGWTVIPFNRGQCPAVDVATTADGGEDNSACDTERQFAISKIQEIKPDLVILVSATDTYYRLASKSKDAAAQTELQAGMAKTLAAVMPSAKQTVVLSDPPAGIALQQCVTRVGKPSDCISGIIGEWKALNNGEKDAVAAAGTGASFIDTRQWFCTASGGCPGFVGSMPVRADTGHMTVEYSTSLGPIVADTLIAK
ncbi:acyltransferase family protein [Subtercola sp. RTI3]|uniref:acyltransferase family protein n=1 Tax=Subtercola sp. RTI3 TaxID=3048639 RepID=UPI002B23E6F6|nr:acyltransferase family protein [Subtercola sp. RTI3]MEA9986304.1 acyltransferase family protein [Subtercola sp. RTI3]